jgi:hypothetical protein
LIKSIAHGLQFDRTDVRAVGEAEEDQHVLAAEVGVATRLAELVGERERPADGRHGFGEQTAPNADAENRDRK